jgi:hypothetical protein
MWFLLKLRFYSLWQKWPTLGIFLGAFGLLAPKILFNLLAFQSFDFEPTRRRFIPETHRTHSIWCLRFYSLIISISEIWCLRFYSLIISISEIWCLRFYSLIISISEIWCQRFYSLIISISEIWSRVKEQSVFKN